MPTNDNKYIPTPAERKLLEVLVNPEHYTKNIKDMCSIAEVDRTVYYDAMKKPEFVEYYHNEVRELLRGKVGNIINATYNFAVRFPGNHQDRKILLEMAGVYEEKQKVESHNINTNLNNVTNLTDAELNKELAKEILKNPELAAEILNAASELK